MNRKALILYIRDLRDLEIAARRIEKLYQEEKKDYEQVLDSLENGKFMSEIEEPIFGVLMGCGVCFLMGYFCNWLKKLVALQLWKAMRKGDKRLKYEDRKEIEKMKNDGVRVVVIAEKIGVHRATIYNELKRGGTPYRAEVAQKTI